MPSSRLYWTGLATASTSASIPVDDHAQMHRQWAWHAYVSGTLGGSSPVVKVEYSPDSPDVSDVSSRWFAPSALQFAAVGDTYFTARFRKARVVITGGDGTTSVTVEIFR